MIKAHTSLLPPPLIESISGVTEGDIKRCEVKPHPPLQFHQSKSRTPPGRVSKVFSRQNEETQAENTTFFYIRVRVLSLVRTHWGLVITPLESPDRESSEALGGSF